MIDNLPTTLANVGGSVTGDAAYAFQFDFTLAPGASQTVTSTTSVAAVPEPSATLGLLVIGGLGAGSMIKRRQKK